VKLWVDWNHIPVAELPATTLIYSNLSSHAGSLQSSAPTLSPGNIVIDGFVWMILRTKHLGPYCNHSLDALSWTDAACLTENPKNIRRILKKGYFVDNNEMVTEVCNRYRFMFEPKHILNHRGCVLKPSNLASYEYSELMANASKCSFETQWAIGEPVRWSTFDAVRSYPAFSAYLKSLFKMNSSNSTSLI
jgi:hypothetical protein